jgi:hypothetical protein
MNKSFFIFICLVSFYKFGFSQTIADCKNPEGFAYYHHNIDKNKKTEFEDDKISGGMLSIQKVNDKTYDLIVVDSRKKITSMTQDGGKFLLLRKGEIDATFLLIFPNSSIEIYTLWLDGKGNSKLDMLQSRGGNDTLLTSHKSSILIANCEPINFSLITNLN